MRSRCLAEGAGARSFVLVLDSGEEAFASLGAFAAKEGISGASVTALGAFERATVGWFDFDKKSYREIEVAEQCEVLSLIGDIALGTTASPACMSTPCWA
jgi:predicted DNA-binding protein with PD1-like motif